jgi:hypothetical protein
MRRQRLGFSGFFTDDFPRNANRQDCEDSPLCNRLIGLCAAFPDLSCFWICHRSSDPLLFAIVCKSTVSLVRQQ